MGEVYLARRRAAGVEKWLVVKRMRPERAGDARFLDLFMREARLSMSLAHQNIVPVFDFGRIDDQVFLAMERVEGQDLGSSLARAGKPLAPMLAAFVAAECCKALDYAHRRKSPEGQNLGIVHRDVTPRNVLLSWSGEVKLTDFGIAALAGDESSKMAGTPAYMAPEQARGEPLDVRADIYAVGMVLREALTGVRPRRGDNRETVLATAKLGTLDPWPEDFTSPLREVVDRATAIEKSDRYLDARSMLEELDAFIVTERSGKKSDAPERQLAAWLADVWKDAPQEDPIDGDIEANQLLSFLDDGPFDVVGTGTQRSMAATAADEAPPEPKVEVAPEPVVKKRSKLPLVLIAGVGIAAIAALAFALGRSDEPTAKQPVAITPTPDAPAVVTPPPPPEPVAVVDAALADASIDAPPTPRPQRPRPHVKDDRTPAIAATKYKAMININLPGKWSNFTVDNDPTVYATPASLQLTPGAHKLHFTGNEFMPLDQTKTITVPEKDGSRHVVEVQPP